MVSASIQAVDTDGTKGDSAYLFLPNVKAIITSLMLRSFEEIIAEK